MSLCMVSGLEVFDWYACGLWHAFQVGSEMQH